VLPEHEAKLDSFPFDDNDDATMAAAAEAQYHRLHKEHDPSIPSPFDDEILQGLEGSAKWKADVQKEQSILHQLAVAENRTLASGRENAGSRKLLQSSTWRECQDQGFACARWASLGYCKYPLYLRYMHSNCEKTCGTCKCQITKPPPSGEVAPGATCVGANPGEGCCTESTQCVSK